MIISGRSLSRKRHQLDDVNTVSSSSSSSSSTSSSSSSSSSSETGSNYKQSSQNTLDKEQRCVSDEEKNHYCGSSDSSLQSETGTSFTERDQLIGPKKTKVKVKREKNALSKATKLNQLVSECSDDDGLVSRSFIQPHNFQVEVSVKEICTEFTGAANQWQYSSLENGSSNAAADIHSRHISGGLHDETEAEMNGVARRNGRAFSATYSAITDSTQSYAHLRACRTH
jgi:hypothetical protein